MTRKRGWSVAIGAPPGDVCDEHHCWEPIKEQGVIDNETIIRRAVESCSELGEAQYLRKETIDVIVSQVLAVVKKLNPSTIIGKVPSENIWRMTNHLGDCREVSLHNHWVDPDGLTWVKSINWRPPSWEANEQTFKDEAYDPNLKITKD